MKDYILNCHCMFCNRDHKIILEESDWKDFMSLPGALTNKKFDKHLVACEGCHPDFTNPKNNVDSIVPELERQRG